jgi:hypothetical protein
MLWPPSMFCRASAQPPARAGAPAPRRRPARAHHAARARGAGTLKDDQHCYLCGQNGHRQFECPNRTDDIYKLPTQMQEKVDNLYQRDVARMAGDAAPSGALARAPASCAPLLPCSAQRRASRGWPLLWGRLARRCGRHGGAVCAGRAREVAHCRRGASGARGRLEARRTAGLSAPPAACLIMHSPGKAPHSPCEGGLRRDARRPSAPGRPRLARGPQLVEPPAGLGGHAPARRVSLVKRASRPAQGAWTTSTRASWRSWAAGRAAGRAAGAKAAPAASPLARPAAAAAALAAAAAAVRALAGALAAALAAAIAATAARACAPATSCRTTASCTWAT